MKKSMLAMSVATAIGGLGFAGSALAIGTVGGAATASVLQLSADGIGHKLVVPYFSTQSGNATLINVVNTDTTNGKLVKVRFRGAGNSDDLLDFQVLMSPGDVWTAAVTQDADTGLSKLVSTDASCVVGLGARADGAYSSLFSTLRTDPTKGAGETREGYVEMVNMADVPPAFNPATGKTNSALYDTIKHVDGVAPCSGTVLEAALGTDPADEAAARLRGMQNPTTGLTGDWILLNQTTTAAWSGPAQSMEARDVIDGVAATGNIAFWPQKFGTPTNAIQTVTADPLLRMGTAGVAPQFYDLPDLSTPYVTGATTAEAQADQNTFQFAVTSIKNQFETSEGIAAVTDWLFSQPTRRYHVAVDYNGVSNTGTAVDVFRSSASPFYTVSTGGTAYYSVDNTRLVGRQVCLDTTEGPGRNSLFDREETTPGIGDNPFVPSPNVPEAAAVVLLCGEANVISFNADGVTAPSALSASVARGDISTDYTNGWASWNLGNGGVGVPVVGQSFMRAANGAVNYGFAFPHKKVRATNAPF
jgi:hypothetical protein